MAMDPATAAKQQADDAQQAVDAARARIADLERSLKEQQDALAREKGIYNDLVRTAQQSRDNATRLRATENLIISSAARSNPPNPVI